MINNSTMKKVLASALFLFFAGLIQINAQKARFQFLAIYNTQPAQPFAKFGSLLIKDLHPGIEYGRGKTIKSGVHHEWIWSNRIGYFYHRFVQHALYVNSDARYRWEKALWVLKAPLVLVCLVLCLQPVYSVLHRMVNIKANLLICD